LKREPKGFLLVPARALDVIARIEASIEAEQRDTTNAVHMDWSAFFSFAEHD
jgi:hypothetical protein